jgi:hypothetical protein
MGRAGLLLVLVKLDVAEIRIDVGMFYSITKLS